MCLGGRIDACWPETTKVVLRQLWMTQRWIHLIWMDDGLLDNGDAIDIDGVRFIDSTDSLIVDEKGQVIGCQSI